MGKYHPRVARNVGCKNLVKYRFYIVFLEIILSFTEITDIINLTFDFLFKSNTFEPPNAM